MRRAALAAAVGAAVLLVSWGLLHIGFYDENQIVDTPTYQRYGEAILDGQVPYRDFAVEYPPGALPVFVLPSLAAEEDYRGAFEWLMWACGAAAILFVACALVAVGASETRLYAATIFAGLVPLALGSVVLTRFDLWPAALVAAALAALVGGRERLGFGVLGLAVAAKLYPRAHPVAYNAVAMVPGALLLLALSLIAGESWALPSQNATWVALAYLVVLGSTALFVAFLFVLGRWTASATSTACSVRGCRSVRRAGTRCSKREPERPSMSDMIGAPPRLPSDGSGRRRRVRPGRGH